MERRPQQALPVGQLQRDPPSGQELWVGPRGPRSEPRPDHLRGDLRTELPRVGAHRAGRVLLLHGAGSPVRHAGTGCLLLYHPTRY